MKLGFSCGALVKRYGYEKALAICKKSGFDTVELGLGFYGNREDPNDIYNASQDEFETFFTNIKRMVDDAGLEISSTHGRMLTYTSDEAQCEYARWASERDLKASGILGAPLCVMHTLHSLHFADRCDDEEFLYSRNAHFFNHLIPFAEVNKVKIAMETHGKTKINDEFRPIFLAHAHQLKKQFDELDTKYKTICVDTGHTNEAHHFGALSVGDTIRYLGENVTHLHLHDNNGVADLHLPPTFDKRDCIDWADVFDALDEINYKGSYNFELNMNHYGDILDEATLFMGKYLRYVIERKGRVN